MVYGYISINRKSQKLSPLIKMGDENIFIAHFTKGDNFCEEVKQAIKIFSLPILQRETTFVRK